MKTDLKYEINVKKSYWSEGKQELGNDILLPTVG